jgi:type IV pilus assembly protein PilY1
MAHCPGGEDCDTRGKGFFVIGLFDDASTGNGKVFWSKTRGDNASMNYAMPTPAALVDTDNDGFIDTAYIGDLGGNIWRFKFCTTAMGNSCSTADWSASLLFNAGGSGRPIYSVPAVARDAYGSQWVYWGTGDKVNPTTSGTQDRFFAVKDADRTSTWTLSDLENISSSVYTDNATKKGWYMNLPTSEKVLADATIFGGVAYFTSYSPGSAGGDACAQAGAANLYAVNYVTGSGSLTSNARKTTLGVGIPTAPTISLNPAGTRPDLYVTLSGGAGTSASTIRAPVSPPYVTNRTNILLWKDSRIQ